MAAIRELVPSADFSDPAWGRVEIPGASIEVNVSVEAQLQSFALHVRAANQAAADQFVAQLLDRLDVHAFDPENETGRCTAPELHPQALRAHPGAGHGRLHSFLAEAATVSWHGIVRHQVPRPR